VTSATFVTAYPPAVQLMYPQPAQPRRSPIATASRLDHRLIRVPRHVAVCLILPILWIPVIALTSGNF
jgi:hypothetical protein